SPPGRASGQLVPPEGLPQFSAGPVAPLAAPRLPADSSSCRQAPIAGPVTPGEGDQPMESPSTTTPVAIASGEKSKARDILAAIRALQNIEQEHRPATPQERQTL